ncbi:MAG: 50S ribosomal protein L18 [Chlamydiota bacterium]|jgi:large subunit ribosomal protein L18
MLSELRRSKQVRIKRKMRVRKKVKGAGQKIRLCVTKSNKNIYAQLIDDKNSRTLFGIGTQSKNLKLSKNKESAKQIGLKIAEFAKQNNIESVIFDRGSFKFHGVIAELANSAREAGMQF